MHETSLQVFGKLADPLYNPPDAFNPNLHPPPGAVDVLNIVEAGVDFQSTLNPDYVTDYYKKPKFEKPPIMPIGKGWSSNQVSSDDGCTGDVDSWCKRDWDNACLLYAHNDGRNGLFHSGYSGWLTLYLPDLKHGDIIIKYESWHLDSEGKPKKLGWKSENNESAERRLLATSNATNNPPEFDLNQFSIYFLLLTRQ